MRIKTKLFFVTAFSSLLAGPVSQGAEVVTSSLTPSQTAQWNRNQYRDPKAYIIEVTSPDNIEYTHSLDLRVVVFKNAGWNDLQLVADHFQRVSEIYSRCHIKLGEISVVVADAGTRTVSEESTADFAARTPSYFEKPIIYFTSEVSSRYHAYAWSGAEPCANNAAKCNTA